MTLAEFKRRLAKRTPPAQLSPALAGARRVVVGGQRQAGHRARADDGRGRQGLRAVHAYLHRVEKDDENARYWYRRAGVPMATGALKAEWAAIARDLLAQSR